MDPCTQVILETTWAILFHKKVDTSSDALSSVDKGYSSKGSLANFLKKKIINPLKLSFQGKGEVFTEGEKETALYRNLSQRD